jgi:Domain of Unknown Function (DUF928)
MASNKITTGELLINLRFFLSFILMGLLLSSAMLSASAKPLTTRRASSKVLFIPPTTDKKPARTSGAASRGGQCMQSSVGAAANPSVKTLAKSPFMALMPVSNSGLTSAEHPSFWIYVPETPAKRLILTLRENGSKPHSQTFFNIPETPGVTSLSLPNSTPALEIGKTYQWAVALICAEKPSPNDPMILSWISRIASAPSTQPNPLEQAAVYGKQGIWFDALTALGQARRVQPNQPELQATWADFLTSAGLQAVASEPLRPETRP